MMTPNGQNSGSRLLESPRYGKTKTSGPADDDRSLSRELFFHGKRIAEEY